MSPSRLGIWTGTAAGLAAGSLLVYAVRGRSSSLLAPSVWRGSRSRPVLALTFDDGPSESTPKLLEILARRRVRATFFMCGQNVRRLPEIARMVHLSGHEIGNHSDTHPRFDFKSAEFIYRELASAQESIQAAAGAAPKLFRAPYGVRWFGLRQAQYSLGLTGVMWTAIGRDWRSSTPQVVRRLARGAVNGGILCLHDGRTVQPAPDIRNTLEAVKNVIPLLQGRGFQFQTVSELLCRPVS
ncbi:MAG TPA: polysaccharide deacetylase family protein, partial [Bryobacteraceae bacterium]|nr:polysaccharide deacetylase family protein [Bryobacteraceae bacterium]